MKLIPYLNFGGHTEEVMNAYAKIFKGTVHDVSRFGDTWPDMPEDAKNGIMHARLSFGDNMLMFSDGTPGRAVNHGDGISLSLGMTDEAEANSVFNQLAEGGKVTMPMAKQFWGAIFGMVTDKYGIHWMINCEVGA
ncbi:MAG TPA: VOC family protein [Mucilaginibacter sp.]|jgi:PhnB protein|nr:VOC family protein [Mucilaginibacter sp.]